MSSNPPTASTATAASQCKITPVAPPRFPFALLFMIWLIVVTIGTLVSFVLPESFAGTARIKIERDHADIENLAGDQSKPVLYDPYFVQQEFEIIQSAMILDKVIDVLKLDERWGKRYGDGTRLKRTQALGMLRGSLKLTAVRNTPLIDVKVYSDDPNEAAELANQIATSYQQWRLDKGKDLVRGGLESLKQQARDLDEEVRLLKAELLKLAGPVENVQLPEAKKQAYLEKQKELEDLSDFRRLLTRKIRVGEIDLNLPRSEQVQIIEHARPNPRPVRPNIPLNIFLSVLIGGGVGLLLAALVYLLQRRVYQRRSGANSSSPSKQRNYLRVAISLVVGVIVGYNCAEPKDLTSLFAIQLFVFLGGIAFVYIELAKPTPTTPLPAASAESHLEGDSRPD